MPIPYMTYRSAAHTLDYIESIKRDMEAILSSKTSPLYSGIALSDKDYILAVRGLGEVVDDLFFYEILHARRMLEAWQEQERLTDPE